jgi:hypothetical protein
MIVPFLVSLWCIVDLDVEKRGGCGSVNVLALSWFDKHFGNASTKEAATRNSGEVANGRNLETWQCVEADLVLSTFSRTNYTGNRCQYVYHVVGDRLQHRAIYGREIIITHTMT